MIQQLKPLLERQKAKKLRFLSFLVFSINLAIYSTYISYDSILTWFYLFYIVL